MEFLGNILSYINPFSENFILKDVLDFLGKMLSYLNPFSENFLGYKLIELIGNLLHSLFIPNENSFVQLTEIVNDKFAFMESIKIHINTMKDMLNNLEGTPSLSLELGATKYTEKQNIKIIDLSWYKPYKQYGDIVLTGLIYFFFLWRIYIRLPSIISGAGGMVETAVKIDRGR